MKRIKLPNLCLFWINKIDIEQNILLLSSSKNRFSACIHIRFFNKLEKHINLYENLYFGYQTLMKLKKLFGGGVIYFALFSTSKLFFFKWLWFWKFSKLLGIFCEKNRCWKSSPSCGVKYFTLVKFLLFWMPVTRKLGIV